MPSALSQAAQNTLIRQLKHDWRTLNRDRFQGRMRPPVFALEPTARQLGQWQSQSRTLQLSTRLLLEHPWGAVLEVLKHEMAHQYCDEVLGVSDEGPHGPTFRALCAELGIDARAAGQPQPDSDVERDRILARVQRLMALADSPEPHEAEAAMAAAHRMMLKYNLAAHETERRATYGVRWLGAPTRRIPAWRRVLSGILTGHFFVEGVWVWSYDPACDRQGRVLEITGTGPNLDIAEWVHTYLVQTGERLWKDHKDNHGIRGNRHRRQFLSGVMVGLYERLQTQREVNETTGLVWAGDPGLKHWTRSRHARVRRSGTRGMKATDMWQHGRSQGRRIVIKKAVTQGVSNGVPIPRLTDRSRRDP